MAEQLSLFFGAKQLAQVGLVIFDVSLNEVHRKSAQVTDHPVEAGVEISDHLVRLPEELEFTGVVSNTPLVFLASAASESPLENDTTPVEDRAGLAYAELRRIMDEGELVTVVTALWVYENMALTSLVVNRDKESGQVLSATMALREVIFTDAQAVAAPKTATAPSAASSPTTPSNAPAANGGTAAAGAATAGQASSAESTSLAWSLLF